MLGFICAAQLKFWFQTDLKLKFSQFLQAGKTCQLLLTFLTKVARWSRSTSNFCTLIGQNLTGEFTRKIYAASFAASWNLFTLPAEADRVLCQLVMFLTVFNSTECTKRNSAPIKSLLLFMASLFSGFLVEKYVALAKSEIRFRMASFSFFNLLNA